MNLGRIEPETLQDVLESIGAVAISFSNAGSDPVLEPTPGSTPLWARTRVSALLPTSLRSDAVADEIQTRLTGADFNSLEFSVIPDYDWQQEWKRHAHPMRFGKRLRVCPSTRKKQETGWAEVVLEPGLAFGTGAHESTAMCLEWLAGTPLEGKLCWISDAVPACWQFPHWRWAHAVRSPSIGMIKPCRRPALTLAEMPVTTSYEC